MQVSQLISKTSGNAVKNQFVISKSGCTYFQSYNTIIAKIARNGKITLDPKWNVSQTTTKYLNQFLNTDKKELLKGIENKTYLVKNLNK